MAELLWYLIDFFLGCSHPKTTWPQSPCGGGRMWVCCLECGKEFTYDWDAMKIIRAPRWRRRSVVATLLVSDLSDPPGWHL